MTAGTPPRPRAGHAAVAVGERLFVFGGGDGENYLNDLSCLDTKTMVWQQVTTSGPIPSPRSRHTATCVGMSLLFLYHYYILMIWQATKYLSLEVEAIRTYFRTFSC